jgi:CHAT domain-containing protein
LTAQQLNLMNLQDCDLQFVYLSCCYGTATASMNELLDDDFLGIADGFTQAGVPRVLGYRWPVSDDGAQRMATSFYEALCGEANGDAATALLYARREVANVKDGRNDATWLSPILLLQAGE